MNLEYRKVALAALWFLLACAAGFALNVSTVSAWAFLASVAVFPPIVMLRFWTPPPQSMSESIQEARR